MALLAPGGNVVTESATRTPGGLQVAFILVLFTYGGWNEMAYVAGEIKHPERNIVRVLVAGTCVVTALYLLMNGTFLHVLGYDGLVASSAVAVETVSAAFPEAAVRAVSVLVCISALGAINGLTFTGGRISYALGEGHALFRIFGVWHGRLGTPVWALVLQGCLSLVIVLVAGSFIEAILYTAPVVWLFFLKTGLSVIILRRREPGTRRPYKLTGYPLTAILFCASCGFMLYSSVSYALAVKPAALLVMTGVVLAGVVVYLLAGHRGSGKLPARV